MSYIWRYVKQNPGLLVLNFIGSMIFVFLNLGLPTVLAQMINEGVLKQDTGAIYKWAFVMIAVIIIGALGRILLSYTSSRMTTRMVRDLRLDMYERIQLFSHHEMETIGVSSLINRMINDAFVLMQFTEMSLRIGFNTPLMFLGSLIMLVVTAPSLSWIIAVAIPLIVLIIIWIAKKSRPLSINQQESLDQINQFARENLSGIRVIRAFTRELFQTKKFEDETDQFSNYASRLYKLMGSAFPLFLHVLIWMTVLIFWFSLRPIEVGTMNVGQLVAFIEYAFHALFSIMMFAQLFMMYPRTAVSAGRIAEVFEIPFAIDENEGGITETDTHGYIEFDNVTFSYPGETEEPVLKNISFKAKPGQMIAFIGSTGSGKSTLVQLIPRFYDVTEGSIKVDGVDVRDYHLPALRQKIGYIPQKALLFTGTIGENLRYGKQDATYEELESASDIAQATDFIENTEQKYDAHLAEGGTNLSGGQKQRLSIARAIVKQPDIYIFDDSFSALDYRTDAKLRSRLKEVTEDATVLVVAQRVSTIMGADQIFVLSEGKIEANGTHDELLQTSELYREIAQSQTKNSTLEEVDYES